MLRDEGGGERGEMGRQTYELDLEKRKRVRLSYI